MTPAEISNKEVSFASVGRISFLEMSFYVSKHQTWLVRGFGVSRQGFFGGSCRVMPRRMFTRNCGCHHINHSYESIRLRCC